MADTKRRARGEDSIFFAPSRKCWVGDNGWLESQRPEGPDHSSGEDKTDVKNKLRAQGPGTGRNVRTPARYTVQQCIEDWLNSLTTRVPDHLDQLPGGG